MVNNEEAKEFAVLAYDHTLPPPKGWIRDNELTDAGSQVYYHPKRQETHISYRGTRSFADLKTAAAMYLGVEDSRIAKESSKFEKAQKRRGSVSLSGHSLGGTLADKMGEKYARRVQNLHTFGAFETPNMHRKDRTCSQPENRKLPECLAQSKRVRTRTLYDPVSGFKYSGANKNVTERHDWRQALGPIPFHSTRVYSRANKKKRTVVPSPGPYIPPKRRRHHPRYSNKG